MEQSLKICEQIAKRERLSRKEAERLLEVKALELYEKTLNIERTKAEVEALNDLLMNVMVSAPDGIVTCNRDFGIQAINLTAERQLGYLPSELIEQPIDLILPGFRQSVTNACSTIFKFDALKAKNSNGGSFIAEVRGTRNGQDDATYYVLFIHDITKELQAQKELKMHEQQIDEARRLEAIGALSAGIAHEINTPIQFIGDNMGFLYEALAKIHKSYTLYQKLTLDARAYPELSELCRNIQNHNENISITQTISDIYESVEESIEGIEQVRDIVLLMKEFAHPGTGGQEQANLNDIIEGVTRISHNKCRGIARVELNLCSDLPTIECRRGQIQQVILNIVMNAADAIEEVGNTPGTIAIATYYDEDQIYIHISDTGPGVPQALKDKVFDPFFTTKPVGKGTGQGLALAKDFIITGHNGQLKFVDVNGYATTFQIILPRHQTNTLTLEHENAA